MYTDLLPHCQRAAGSRSQTRRAGTVHSSLVLVSMSDSTGAESHVPAVTLQQLFDAALYPGCPTIHKASWEQTRPQLPGCPLAWDNAVL